METTTLRGQFIVAMPQLEDPNFHRTVVLLCEHSNEGAMGLVVNKPLPFTLDQVYEGQNIEEHAHGGDQVHFGGPVQTEVGFLLYTGGAGYEGSLYVSEGIYLGTSIDILRDIASGRGPARFIFALGYAGWGPDQLENELARNDWLVVPCNPALLFSTPAQDRWENAIRSLGIDPGLIIHTTGSA